jgi:hypothetical protein
MIGKLDNEKDSFNVKGKWSSYTLWRFVWKRGQ